MDEPVCSFLLYGLIELRTYNEFCRPAQYQDYSQSYNQSDRNYSLPACNNRFDTDKNQSRLKGNPEYPCRIVKKAMCKIPAEKAANCGRIAAGRAGQACYALENAIKAHDSPCIKDWIYQCADTAQCYQEIDKVPAAA